MFKAVCKVIYLLLYYHQVSYKPYLTPHRIIYPKGFISLINLIQSIPCRFTNCYIHLALPESKNSSNCLILIVGRIYTFSRDSVYHVISLSFISDSEAFEAFDGFIDMTLVTPSILLIRQWHDPIQILYCLVKQWWNRMHTALSTAI